jgi:hypothetical protein
MKSLSRKRQVLAASYLNNGGFMYAFPNVHNPLTGTQESGMTMRDYFAAKVIAVIVDDLYKDGLYITENEDVVERAAIAAYEMADKMMKARDA